MSATNMVRVTGVEPAHLAAQDPKSCASANSAIPAFMFYNIIHIITGCIYCQGKTPLNLLIFSLKNRLHYVKLYLHSCRQAVSK